MNHERSVWPSFCNERPTLVRVIIDGCYIGERKIKAAHVGEASPVAPNHDVTRYTVATLSNAPCYAVERGLRRG